MRQDDFGLETFNSSQDPWGCQIPFVRTVWSSLSFEGTNFSHFYKMMSIKLNLFIALLKIFYCISIDFLMLLIKGLFECPHPNQSSRDKSSEALYVLHLWLHMRPEAQARSARAYPHG